MTSYLFITEDRVAEFASAAIDNIEVYREKKKKKLHDKWLADKNKKTWWREIFGYPKYDDTYEGIKKYYNSLDMYNSEFWYAENAYRDTYDRLIKLTKSFKRMSMELVQISVEDANMINNWSQKENI